MKYIPKPDCALIQLIDNPAPTPKMSCIILPNQIPKTQHAKVLAIGSEVKFVHVDMIIIYDKYQLKCINEDEKIYSTTLEGVICAASEE